MTALSQQVLTDENRNKLVTECTQLIAVEISGKSGLKSIPIKGAYKVVNAIRPDFISGVVDALLDEFIGKLDPYYETYTTASPSGSFGHYVNSRGPEVADSLLEVTDQRARTTNHTTAKKAYLKLRPTAVTHIVAALPRVGKMIDSYI